MGAAVGEIRVTPENGHLIYEMGLNETPLTALAGGASHIDVVAGAGLQINETAWRAQILLR